MEKDDYMKIKADVFRIIRSHSDKSPRHIIKLLRERLPDVDMITITQCIIDLQRP